MAIYFLLTYSKILYEIQNKNLSKKNSHPNSHIHMSQPQQNVQKDKQNYPNQFFMNNVDNKYQTIVRKNKDILNIKNVENQSKLNINNCGKNSQRVEHQDNQYKKNEKVTKESTFSMQRQNIQKQRIQQDKKQYSYSRILDDLTLDDNEEEQINNKQQINLHDLKKETILDNQNQKNTQKSNYLLINNIMEKNKAQVSGISLISDQQSQQEKKQQMVQAETQQRHKISDIQKNQVLQAQTQHKDTLKSCKQVLSNKQAILKGEKFEQQNQLVSQSSQSQTEEWQSKLQVYHQQQQDQAKNDKQIIDFLPTHSVSNSHNNLAKSKSGSHDNPSSGSVKDEQLQLYDEQNIIPVNQLQNTLNYVLDNVGMTYLDNLGNVTEQSKHQLLLPPEVCSSSTYKPNQNKNNQIINENKPQNKDSQIKNIKERQKLPSSNLNKDFIIKENQTIKQKQNTKKNQPKQSLSITNTLPSNPSKPISSKQSDNRTIQSVNKKIQKKTSLTQKSYKQVKTQSKKTSFNEGKSSNSNMQIGHMNQKSLKSASYINQKKQIRQTKYKTNSVHQYEQNDYTQRCQPSSRSQKFYNHHVEQPQIHDQKQHLYLNHHPHQRHYQRYDQFHKKHSQYQVPYPQSYYQNNKNYKHYRPQPYEYNQKLFMNPSFKKPNQIPPYYNYPPSSGWNIPINGKMPQNPSYQPWVNQKVMAAHQKHYQQLRKKQFLTSYQRQALQKYIQHQKYKHNFMGYYPFPINFPVNEYYMNPYNNWAPYYQENPYLPPQKQQISQQQVNKNKVLPDDILKQQDVMKNIQKRQRTQKIIKKLLQVQDFQKKIQKRLHAEKKTQQYRFQQKIDKKQIKKQVKKQIKKQIFYPDTFVRQNKILHQNGAKTFVVYDIPIIVTKLKKFNELSGDIFLLPYSPVMIHDNTPSKLIQYLQKYTGITILKQLSEMNDKYRNQHGCDIPQGTLNKIRLKIKDKQINFSALYLLKLTSMIDQGSSNPYGKQVLKKGLYKVIQTLIQNLKNVYRGEKVQKSLIIHGGFFPGITRQQTPNTVCNFLCLALGAYNTEHKKLSTKINRIIINVTKQSQYEKYCVALKKIRQQYAKIYNL